MEQIYVVLEQELSCLQAKWGQSLGYVGGVDHQDLMEEEPLILMTDAMSVVSVDTTLMIALEVEKDTETVVVAEEEGLTQGVIQGVVAGAEAETAPVVDQMCDSPGLVLSQLTPTDVLRYLASVL